MIIEFCCKSNCPVVKTDLFYVMLGDENGPEGITTWSKDQFRDFVEAAKEGKFDSI